MSVPDTGIVVIGRNEGPRLRRCIESARRADLPVVYVDSGSRDGSPELARELGCLVVELDVEQGFTAARGRNAGVAALREVHPGLALIQFLDGDCELETGWIKQARGVLLANPQLGVVFGRRRERHPERSIYNRLADLEWDGVPGDAAYCGGDAMIRLEAFDRAGGYPAECIAGEEPEICLVIRRLGWRVVRLATPMTIHDADIHSFSQWWQRQVRAGHAYGEGALRRGREPERFRVREISSILFWGGLLPVASGISVVLFGPTLLGAPIAAYGLLWLRAAPRRFSRRQRALYASFVLLAKFAHMQGVFVFIGRRLRLQRRAKLIEYKAPPPDSPRAKAPSRRRTQRRTP